MKLTYLYIKMRYNTFDRFELESKPEVKGAGKIRRGLAWFFITTGLAILFGQNGYNLSINGKNKEVNPQLTEQDKKKNRIPYSPDSNVQWT